jgi:hypothetical protein
VTSTPAPPGVLSVVPGRRPTPQRPAPVAPEALPTGDASQAPRDQEA